MEVEIDSSLTLQMFTETKRRPKDIRSSRTSLCERKKEEGETWGLYLGLNTTSPRTIDLW